MSDALIPNSTRPMPCLTERERQVATLLADGYGRKRIAVELGIAPDTVDDYLKSLAVKIPGNGRRALRIQRFVLLVAASDQAA